MNTNRSTMIALLGLLLLAGLAAGSSAQAGPGPGRGQGGCLRLAFDAPKDDASLIAAKLDAAIRDEYHSRALYSAVLDRFGAVRPFSNIVEAEQRHIDALARLYVKYGLAVPGDSSTGGEPAFDSLLDAARAALKAERENTALYDGLLAGVTDTDVIAVFENLQWASRERHLPALENYVDNGGECPRADSPGGGARQGGRGQGRGGCWRR